MDFDWVLKMKIYFHDGGFLFDGINQIPSTAVEVTSEEYEQILAGQSQGKTVSTDVNGKPFLTEQVFIETLVQQRDEILFQLKRIDDKKVRAITDFILNGDKTFLEQLEEEAVQLRTRLKSLEY